jgi:hypothetical protein
MQFASTRLIDAAKPTLRSFEQWMQAELRAVESALKAWSPT